MKGVPWGRLIRLLLATVTVGVVVIVVVVPAYFMWRLVVSSGGGVDVVVVEGVDMVDVVRSRLVSVGVVLGIRE